MKKVILAVAALIVLAGGLFAWRMMAPPPDDLDLARSKATQGGSFVVAVAPEVEPVQQGPLHGWIVTVTTPDGTPVDDATIAVDGGMPQHGHGLPTAPAVTAALGEGRYRIEGVRFNMSGWWELKLSVTAGGTTEAVTFNLLV